MVLVVNGEKIEDSAIQKEVERLRPRYEKVFADMGPAERETQLLNWSKENVIEAVLIKQEAQKNRDKIPKDEVDSLLASLKQDKDKGALSKEPGEEDNEKMREAAGMVLSIDHMVKDICKGLPDPSKDAVLKYYEENKDEFESGEQVRVAHIVKYVNWQTDEQAAYNAIKQAQYELERGVPFEIVVDRYADSDDSGDPAYIIRGKMAEEFDDVVFNLDVGEVSDIFRTRFGFHIAKVYDRKPAVAPKLEEVKSKIAGILESQAREKAIEDFIDQLKSKARIEEV